MHFHKLFLLLPILLLHLQQSQACFSRGNSGEPSDGNPEAQGLKSENDVRTVQLKKEKQTDETEEEKDEESSAEQKLPSELDPEFVKTYLREFGHLKHNENGLSHGVKHFQRFLGYRQTGNVDLATLQKMSWKRCANSDEGYTAQDPSQLWERSTLFWNLNASHPKQFTHGETKELIAQAFRAWEIVIKIDFLETNNADNAQIIFTFESDGAKKEKSKNGEEEKEKEGKTGLAIAKASSPPVARIVLNADENWSTFQTQEEGKIDIFVVLLHEIGHALGLRHSGDEHSVMFPMFERSVGEHLPVISNDDVEHLRALYEGDLTDRPTLAADLRPTRPVPVQGGTHSTDSYGGEGATTAAGKEAEKCPHSITTAANVNSETLFLFKDGYAWHLSRGKLVGGPYKISEFFPDGPEKVDVAFSSGRLTVLVKSRMLFGYEFDQKTAQFTRDHRYPRELHSRILFYPEGAFPIVNGSVILFKDDVFATYNVESNTPHLFGSMSEFFPGLPQNLRAGFAATPDFTTYHMLTNDYAFLYDVRVARTVSSQSIGQFVGCEGNKLMPPGPPMPHLFFPYQPSPPQNPRFPQQNYGK
uniref:Matrix metalloproteinase n=1 Tax=Heterodera glycines TaxID=51029 RepID=Q6TA10_HETGL|nr:matrix metalloproteinase [Heterodera glycines]AAR11446.1 matrix metalloproteinase [Heterodera glycines]